ncbi:hypothetical protein N9L76_03725, partial [bacterium]|nr:hypothetical protein [bacterium]
MSSARGCVEFCGTRDWQNPPSTMGDDDDDLYDELYGDEEDTPVELPAAPVPKSGGFKIPKVVEPEPVPVPEPVPEPTVDATTAKADDSDSDDFDIALNEPDV